MESTTSSSSQTSASGNGAGIPVENPATGETIATVPELGAADVTAMVERARAAQPGWAAAGFEERARVLMAARLDGHERQPRRRDHLPAPPTRRSSRSFLLISALEFWAKSAPAYLADEDAETASPPCAAAAG